MRKTTRPARRATATKVVASVALLAGAASVAGLGTFGAFTDTTAADQAVATGTVELGALPTTIDAPVTGMVPGDRVERQVTLTRAAGSQTFGSLRLTTTSVGDQVLTAADTGVKLSVDECSVPWTADGKALECGGQTTPVLTSGPVLGQGRDLVTPLLSVNGTGATSHLRITMLLPRTEADQNGLQGKSATVKFTFDAGQRDGEAR
ncbi:TasA family protein [Nocardioides sp. zg-DK7169]|uniref:TasA family protein n=1 Tax=Nocardioides sp. zg-DK7169 TaxID=2736600 RepID=UPI001556F1B9|nr:TasA family protein [Nocardioides sp. zg-DK7169]NPC96631.1 hypothetical protein [Nocardioides sp. zg-DK7169]